MGQGTNSRFTPRMPMAPGNLRQMIDRGQVMPSSDLGQRMMLQPKPPMHTTPLPPPEQQLLPPGIPRKPATLGRSTDLRLPAMPFRMY